MNILISEGFHDKHTVEIKLNESALEEIIPLLKYLKGMGDVGMSRSISIEDEKETFGFDGDGPSRIISIKVDDKEINYKDE